MANRIYNQLKSEIKRLNAVKEQIFMMNLGPGWLDVHHPWSTCGEVLYFCHLLKHLTEKLSWKCSRHFGDMSSRHSP